MSQVPVTYTLESGGTTYTNAHISASLIIDLVTELTDYIVLEPSEYLNQTIYIQVAVIGSPDDLVIETRQLIDNQNAFRHYSHMPANREEVIHILLAYWGNQQIPDLSQWQDITSEFE